jgi:hypothetical protein
MINSEVQEKIKYDDSKYQSLLKEWEKPSLVELLVSNTYDTPENCAPTKFGGTGDTLGINGPDCGPPIS